MSRVRGVDADSTIAARRLRRRLTPAEKALWDVLRDRKLDRLKFRRQQPLGPYILDFCCSEHRLIVEVDGAVHDVQKEQDAARTEHLEAYGYTVLRFSNTDVLNNLDAVLNVIRTAATQESRSPLSQNWERGRG